MSKVYYTRYALTKGIMEFPEYELEKNKNYISIKTHNLNALNGHILAFKGEYFFTEEEAIARANEMRLKKITNLEKQIAKLKNIEF